MARAKAQYGQTFKNLDVDNDGDFNLEDLKRMMGEGAALATKRKCGTPS